MIKGKMVKVSKEERRRSVIITWKLHEVAETNNPAPCSSINQTHYNLTFSEQDVLPLTLYNLKTIAHNNVLMFHQTNVPHQSEQSSESGQ